MTGFLVLCFLSRASVVAGSPGLDSVEALRVAVESEVAYFVPLDKEEPLSWNGVIYDQGTKRCFSIHHKTASQVVRATELRCPKEVLDAATEPYDRIPDFEAFKKKFLGCLHRQDRKCLRRLTRRNVQISFGVDGPGDRRSKLYPTWKKKDFEEAASLMRKGVASSGDFRGFPYPQSDDYIGMRGAFTKKNDGWLLTYYLGGD